MELHMTNSPEISYTSNSQEMANEMATYHQNIQAHDIDPPGPTRNDTIKEMLINIPCLNTKDNLSLDNELSYAEIEHAIKCSPNDKAPGLNGIPTEIYKFLHKRHIKNIKNDKPSFDIVALLKAAFNDIETNGVRDKCLLDGWLCLIYKKKDRCEVANYRPITVLNAEYKILTTALMGKLSVLAPKLINKCQAAFIKG